MFSGLYWTWCCQPSLCSIMCISMLVKCLRDAALSVSFHEKFQVRPTSGNQMSPDFLNSKPIWTPICLVFLKKVYKKLFSSWKFLRSQLKFEIQISNVLQLTCENDSFSKTVLICNSLENFFKNQCSKTLNLVHTHSHKELLHPLASWVGLEYFFSQWGKRMRILYVFPA